MGRVLVPELMDGEPVGYDAIATCLRHIAAINRVSGAYRPTLDWLGRLPRQAAPLRILDVGCGYGDMLRRIAGWAAGCKVAVALTGVDRNPLAVQVAQAATPAGLPIRYRVADAFELDEWPDVVISALFAHHLDDGEVARFLRWMEHRTRLGWFVNDLHRHPLPHAVARGLAAVLPISPLVAHDAPVSVARAFTAGDWRALLATAEVSARIEWFFPFRLCVGRIR